MTHGSSLMSMSISACSSTVASEAAIAALHGSQLSSFVNIELQATSIVSITFVKILVASSHFEDLFTIEWVFTGER